MPKVLCKLKNASAKINGVSFVSHKLGMISEEVDDAVAKHFASIPGYEVYAPGESSEVAEAILEKARQEREAAEAAARAKAGAQASPTNPGAGAPSVPPPAPPKAAPPPSGATGGTPEPSF
jgi:hypothetical protein